MGVIILIIIIVALGTVGTSLIGALAVDTSDDFESIIELLTKGSQPKPKPTASELLCDLKLIVHAEYDQTLPLSDFFIRIISSGNVDAIHDSAKEYQWRDCHQSTEVPIASLLDFSIGDGQPLSLFPVFIGEGEAVITEIVLLDPNTGLTIDKSNDRTLRRSIDLPAGIAINLPLDLTQTYIIKNIPHRDYELQIFFPDHEINRMGKGQPFIDEVCEFTKMTCFN
ncbi:MAG: hypothetical protein KJI69_04320 [Patescibacteria group bacterium]|nr:hypothetical protein [Patescibacteria group bacterium]